MCCYLTALFQTEEAECYFWSSLNQKLWLFTKAAPQDIKSVFGNICDKKKKKKQTVKINWDHLVIGQRGLPAAFHVVFFFFFKPLLLHFSPFAGRNCTQSPIAKQITAESQTPLFGRDLSPLNILFYWCYGKKLEIHKESTVVIVKMQVWYKKPWARSYNSPASTRGWH